MTQRVHRVSLSIHLAGAVLSLPGSGRVLFPFSVLHRGGRLLQPSPHLGANALHCILIYCTALHSTELHWDVLHTVITRGDNCWYSNWEKWTKEAGKGYSLQLTPKYLTLSVLKNDMPSFLVANHWYPTFKVLKVLHCSMGYGGWSPVLRDEVLGQDGNTSWLPMSHR